MEKCYFSPAHKLFGMGGGNNRRFFMIVDECMFDNKNRVGVEIWTPLSEQNFINLNMAVIRVFGI